MADTYFAPAGRRSTKRLAQDVAAVTKNPIIDAVMQSVGGLLAVLNEKRQILAVNDALLHLLGIGDIAAVIGRRPGEALGCVHTGKGPDGCGTTPFCATCGAAIAILSSLDTDTPQERDCAATVHLNGEKKDLMFRVRAHPIVDRGHRYLLFFLQDTTAHQRRMSLERVFFHDINNIIYGLQGVADLIDCKDDKNTPRMLTSMRQLVARLTREVKIQQALSGKNGGGYSARFQGVVLSEVFEELAAIMENHPAAAGQRVIMPRRAPWPDIHTDRSLLIRILTNMLVNALEAGSGGDTVRLVVAAGDGRICFSVWNRQDIPEPVALRIFQRHFTTKRAPGRGLGTYAMKLFGENILGGEVSFETGPAGTTFRLILPL